MIKCTFVACIINNLSTMKTKETDNITNDVILLEWNEDTQQWRVNSGEHQPYSDGYMPVLSATRHDVEAFVYAADFYRGATEGLKKKTMSCSDMIALHDFAYILLRFYQSNNSAVCFSVCCPA